MADIPVPAGWEQVPAVGTGIGIQETIKTTAVIRPTKGLNDKSVFEIILSLQLPYATKGIATPNQKAAQLKGKIPSDICMAYESLDSNNTKIDPYISIRSLNFVFVKRITYIPS
jgi:hypothetical protein